ncbi:unnamed protein product, partial [marine sediment metagenome]
MSKLKTLEQSNCEKLEYYCNQDKSLKNGIICP